MNSWLESPTYKRVGTLFVVQSKDDPAQNKSRTLGCMERTSVVDVPTERGKWTFVEMLLYRKEKSKLFKGKSNSMDEKIDNEIYLCL